MKKYINTSNYYLSTTTSTIPSSIVNKNEWHFDVSDITVDGVTLPLKGYYWVDVDFGDVSKREIFRVYKREGYRLFFDDRISPSGAVAHASGASVGLRDFSQLLNSLSTNTDNFGEVEKVGDLEILVRGGEVYSTSNMNAKTGKIHLDDTTFDSSDISINSELYLVLEYDELSGWGFAIKTEQLLTDEYQYPLAKIVTGATNISEITDLRATIVGQGNMRREVYDPDGLAEGQTTKDVFDMDLMKQGNERLWVTPAQVELWNSYQETKQDLLISGTNIKTINNISVLGSGDIDTNQVSNDSYSDSWDGVDNIAPSKNAVYDKIKTIDIDVSGKQDTLIPGSNIQIASDGKTISATDTTYVAGDFDIKDLADSTSLRNKWDNKQNALVAGPNITIDGNTISAINTLYLAGTGLTLNGTTFNNTGVLSVNGNNGVITVDEFKPSNTGNVGQVLKKTSDSYEWSAETDAVTSVNGQTGNVTVNEFSPLNVGETGQVLKKTSTGYSWGNESGGGGGDYTAGEGINISSQNEISNTGVLTVNNQTGDIVIDAIGSSNDTYDNIIHLTQAQFDTLAVKDPNTLYSTPEGTEGDAFAPGNAGTSGQVLTKTTNSYQWSNAPVASVNGQTGVVSLSIPTNTSDLNNDSGYVTNQVSDDSYSPSWNGDTTHAPSKNAIYNKINSLDVLEEMTQEEYDDLPSSKETDGVWRLIYE